MTASTRVRMPALVVGILMAVPCTVACGVSPRDDKSGTSGLDADQGGDPMGDLDGTGDGLDSGGTGDGTGGGDTADGGDDQGDTADGGDDQGDTSDGGDDQGDTSDGGDGDDGDDGGGPDLPPPVGACPTFTDGELTFNPAGGARTVRIWVDPARADLDGPVVFYWYGTGGQPSQAQSALGAGISTITEMGGIVAAPVHANSGTYPWLGGGDSDMRLADEVVACAEQEIGIDQRRIHAFGMSAGGLFTSQLSFGRSSYFASVATWSGGGSGQFEDSSNKFAAMIFHGGEGDVFVTDFRMLSEQYQSALLGNGNFAFICDHGMGHTFPPGGGAPTLQFFLDHPYGTNPSPYESGFPAGVPDYCSLP